MENEMADLVAAVRRNAQVVEGLPAGMSAVVRARKMEIAVSGVEMVLEQLRLLKEGCSERKAELVRRLADVEKTIGELGSVQLVFKAEAEAKVRLVAIACAEREEAAAQRASTAEQRVNELQIELAAERVRRVKAEGETECAHAEAGIWQGRLCEVQVVLAGLGRDAGEFRVARESTEQEGSPVSDAAAGEGLGASQSASQVGNETEREEWVGFSSTGGDEAAVEESRAPRPENEAGDEVEDEEMSEAVQLNGLQKVLESVVWPAMWDEERCRQLYGELMRRNNAAALGEDEWRASFERAVSEGIGACLVPMLVEVMRTGYRMSVRSQKDSRRSCLTHGKKVNRAGPCVWVAREVGVVSPRLMIKERT